MEIAVIGAGGSFVGGFLQDLFQSRVAIPVRLRLFDLRPAASERVCAMVGQLAALTGLDIQASVAQSRKDAIAGCDHVLACFAVGFPHGVIRTAQRLRVHGIDAVDGETATPGAIMATYRMLPTFLELAEDMRRECPDAWIHITGNPMAQIVDGLIRFGGMERVIGHCHGSIHMIRLLGELFHCPPSEIDFFAAGINHFHLVQRAVHEPTGEDLLARLRCEEAVQADLKLRQHSLWVTFRDLGQLMGHGFVHHHDFLPYAGRRTFPRGFPGVHTWPDLLLQQMPPPGWDTTTASAAGKQLSSQTEARQLLEKENVENIFQVMAALSGVVAPFRFHSANILNQSLLAGLPENAIVEVTGEIGVNQVSGLLPPEPLPRYFTAWLHTHITIRQLTVEAVVEKSRVKAMEAIACDPTYRGCNLSPEELLEELFDANSGLVERF